MFIYCGNERVENLKNSFSFCKITITLDHEFKIKFSFARVNTVCLVFCYKLLKLFGSKFGVKIDFVKLRNCVFARFKNMFFTRIAARRIRKLKNPSLHSVGEFYVFHTRHILVNIGYLSGFPRAERSVF